jgi:hypothetical protein
VDKLVAYGEKKVLPDARASCLALWKSLTWMLLEMQLLSVNSFSGLFAAQNSCDQQARQKLQSEPKTPSVFCFHSVVATRRVEG